VLVSAVTCLHLGGPDCCTPSFLVAYLSSYSGTLSDDDRLIRRYPLHYTPRVASSLYLRQTRYLSNIGVFALHLDTCSQNATRSL
jgi:hypothetical protein